MSPTPTAERDGAAGHGGPRGTEQHVRLRMDDGVELAATLYLPDPALGPQPCLLEALPYRKDDLTSNAVDEYRLLRDEHGYAVCRVDLRGTGSSGGDAVDEYPAREQADLVDVIAWLGSQDWCTGAVGMWGTSYSGFNSLQLACERPPALRAVCAIYATDDRWTDDVHWRGGALRLVDLVDYCHYMSAMNVLPPVPSLWPDDQVTPGPAEAWRQEWRRRLATHEPWVLTWLRENRGGSVAPYWRHGSVRRPDPASPSGWSGYERIACPVMLVAGWADGYRNNSFRTVAALREAGVPVHLLAGPWAHADPAAAIPGPRIDLVPEMVAWWDRWLRDEGSRQGRPAEGEDARIDVFVRSSTRPDPALELHEGRWVCDTWPSERSGVVSVPLPGPRVLPDRPDVGTAAWIDCAGHLPWGLSDDQRLDDALSAAWDLAPSEVTAALGGRAVLGQPRVRLRVSTDAPAASLSVKLCDVFVDGTSALVTRGTLDLAYRDGVHGAPSPLVPGDAYDVDLELDACAYTFDDEQALRVSVACADWPNTVAPPAPVRVTVHEAELVLPTYDLTDAPVPRFAPGAARSAESMDGVTWQVENDVLAGRTTARTSSDAEYETPGGGWAEEHYAGAVIIDRVTHAQRADAVCTFALQWPGVDARVTSSMTVDVRPSACDVAIVTEAWEDGVSVSRRTWHETLPR